MAASQPIAVRAAEDNAQGRLQDMDTEGRDIDFIIPGTWAYGAPALAQDSSPPASLLLSHGKKAGGE